MSYDVVGVGGPLLDLIYQVDDAFLERMEMSKGHMTLVDTAGSERVLDALEDYKSHVSPGGTVPNTLAGIALLGGNTLFMGKLGSDMFGQLFRDGLDNSGVSSHMNTHETQATGHAITLITPDRERTFATHLGAAATLTRDDVDMDKLAEGSIVHFEGYLLDYAKEVVEFGMKEAKRAGALVSFDLSDAELIGRHKDHMIDVIDRYVDILFANEDETRAYTGADADAGLAALSAQCDIAVYKQSSKGSIVRAHGTDYEFSAEKREVVNTSGAGDAYAAGLLFALAKEIPLEVAGKIASYLGAEAVSQESAMLGDSHRRKVVDKLKEFGYDSES